MPDSPPPPSDVSEPKPSEEPRRLLPPNKDPNFRANPDRSIRVFGEFGESMVRELAPQIIQLRHDDATAPITVYIDSEGGSIQHYDYLVGLLFDPDTDGNICRIVTVATSYAASAAARLLARGDYSIAYPSALIHCHGSRFEGGTVTRERAELMSQSLAAFNADMAGDFTHKIIENLVWLYRFNDEEITSRKGRGIHGLSALIRANLEGTSKSLMNGVLAELDQTTELEKFLLAPSRETSLEKALNRGQGHGDFRLLKLIVDFLESTTSNAQLSRGISRRTLDSLLSMYSLRRDYYKNFIRDCDDPDSLLMMLCTPEQIEEAQEIEDEVKRNEYLLDKAGSSLFNAWQLGSTIAANLVKGENSLSASDAYWLGIVDEVSGRSDLMCKRQVMENSSDEASK
jgi:ATP-dependent protease ClpP protease subunit